ncbi:MAG: metallophosphoesterase family protein [Ignavibacteria bacterium]|nr:metallophosphoesterase family protein [Ignavibacteria bacterium]
MKVAVISDLHANLEATEACFKEIEKISVDKVICLGDLVDYCAQPNEVSILIKQKCDTVILGNHDEAQFNYLLSEGFSEQAKISSYHTRKIIKPEHIEYLKTLPRIYTINELMFVHSSPFEPHNYNYVLDEDDALFNFDYFSQKVCFIGHSHIPVIFKKSGENISIINDGKLDINSRYIINVGSVGQPRDRDPRLSFGIFDTADFTYKNIRVSYDVKSASNKILKEGLPDFLALRILEGR